MFLYIVQKAEPEAPQDDPAECLSLKSVLNLGIRHSAASSMIQTSNVQGKKRAEGAGECSRAGTGLST